MKVTTGLHQKNLAVPDDSLDFSDTLDEVMRGMIMY